MRIGFHHLSYFIASAENGSFRKASRELGVRESAISRRVRDLEDQIGASLFHRRSSGITLTYAGETFLRRARTIVNCINTMASETAVIGRGEEGRVSIGIFSSLASGFLSQLLQEFGQAHPAVHVEIINGNPSDHACAIRRLRLDVAFVTGTRDWPDCYSEELWTERVFLACPENHRLAKYTDTSWSEMEGEEFLVSRAAPGQEIRDYLIQRLADLGYSPKIVTHAVGRDDILALVAIGRGLTVTSEATTAATLPGVHYCSIAGELLPFGAIWSPMNDNPALRRLLSVARNLSRATKRAS